LLGTECEFETKRNSPFVSMRLKVRLKVLKVLCLRHCNLHSVEPHLCRANTRGIPSW